ncbi:hypothetical protein [Metabacillus fastidiosus]|uniref:hypothetical protein n=1 Tax=Metabacillus fastidiosus TaxID=1458 RepID=UPI002E1EC6A2|nr:hypothetical protein [Metabacillus fastidiosus]
MKECPCDNIGPRAVKVKSHKHVEECCHHVCGIICNVGFDFVDLLQEDGDVATVLTDRIKKIKIKHKDCHSNFFDGLDSCFDEEHDFRSDCDCERCSCNRDITCFKDNVIAFCDRRVQLRLAGLEHSLNADLLRHQGCEVLFELKS